jgi:hypothetical protein
MKRRCAIVGRPVEVSSDLYEITTDVAAADIVIVEGVWFSRLRPLDADDDAIAAYLRERGILEPHDLDRLNLDELAMAPGVGRQALHRFIRDLSRSGRYPETNRLQDFIIRRGIFV